MCQCKSLTPKIKPFLFKILPDTNWLHLGLNPQPLSHEAIKLTIVSPLGGLDWNSKNVSFSFFSSFSNFLKIIGHPKDGGLIYHEFLLYENLFLRSPLPFLFRLWLLHSRLILIHILPLFVWVGVHPSVLAPFKGWNECTIAISNHANKSTWQVKEDCKETNKT